MIKFFRIKSNSPFFSPDEQKKIILAIQEAETFTTGEIRLFVESKCKYVNALDRAVPIFQHLQMDKTDNKNAVLIYIAMKDHQLAIYGDEGIHQKVSDDFWKKELTKIINAFNTKNYVEGIVTVINDVGEILKTYFPAEANSTNKNELPDDIVFGS